MGRPADSLLAKIQANHPGAALEVVGRRFVRATRPDGKKVARFVNYPLADSAGAVIDTGLTTGNAPWQYKVETADHRIQFGNGGLGFNTGQLVEWLDKATGATINLQPEPLYWVDVNGGIQPAGAVGAVAGAVNDNAVTWANGWGAGRHITWTINPEQLVTLARIDSLAALPVAPANVSHLRLSFILQTDNSTDIRINGQVWDRRANNPQTTAGRVEFVRGGTSIFSFDPAAVWDSRNEDILPNRHAPGVTTHVRRTGPNVFVETRVPAVWLLAAQYPVFIDPTINLTPNIDAALEGYDATVKTTNYGSTATMTARAGDRYYVMRFDLSSIGASDTIDDTELTLRTASIKEGGGSNQNFHALLVDWVESEVTWTIRKTGTNWNTGGATGNGTDRETTPFASAGNWPSWQTDTVWVPIALGNTGLTQQVQDWVNGTLTNNGIQVEATSLAGTSYAIYTSNEATAARRPDLEVVYTVGATPTALTPTGLVVGGPVVGKPAIGQTHALTPTGLVANPQVGAPALGQTHALTPAGLVANPEVGAPALGQTHALTPTGLVANPEVGAPALGQTHALTPTGLTTTPTLGTPELTSTGAANLTPTGLVANPEVGAPALGQTHALTPTGLVANPEAGAPALGQTHALTPTGLVANPEVGAPALGQTHALTPTGLVANPGVGAPALGQTHALTPTGLVANPEVGAPVLGQAGAANLTPVALLVLAPVLGAPWLAAIEAGLLHTLDTPARYRPRGVLDLELLTLDKNKRYTQ